MQWNVERHRGAGFTLYPLHPVGAYPALSALYTHIHLRRLDVEHLLTETAPDALLVGLRDVSGGVRSALAQLIDTGLVVQCVRGDFGTPARFEITRLGAGVVEALCPLTQWGLRRFLHLVLATRMDHSMYPPAVTVLPESRRAPLATEMALGLVATRWALTVLMYIDSAGVDGVGPARLQIRVNQDLEASSGASRVEWRLTQESARTELWRLVRGGLVTRQVAPDAMPMQVRYLLTPMGRELMAALWEVAEWGMAHDAELFAMVARTSGWFPDAPTV